MANENRNRTALGAAAIQTEWLHSTYRRREMNETDVVWAEVTPRGMHDNSIGYVIA
jgi:hypothetical protein